MDGVVQESVADVCFMDVSRLRVGDVERLVAAVPVGSVHKFMMEL